MGYHRLRSLGGDRSTFFDTATLAILGAAYDKAIANLHDRRQPNIVREVIARRIASSPSVVLATPIYFARSGEPSKPGDLAGHEAVIYDQPGGGSTWPFQRDEAQIAVTLKGRLRVTAAEGLRAAVLANAGLAIVSEWMFAPEIADGTVKVVLKDWQLPRMDLWAVFPAGRTATAKARTFAEFVREVMYVPGGANSEKL